MKFHLDFRDVPEWLYWILKYLNIGRIYAIPEHSEKVLNELIQNNSLKAARLYLDFLECKHGVSTHTVKYATKISVIELLEE
jgi:hypothetical protein